MQYTASICIWRIYIEKKMEKYWQSHLLFSVSNNVHWILVPKGKWMLMSTN